MARLVPRPSSGGQQASPSQPSWSAKADHPRVCWPRARPEENGSRSTRSLSEVTEEKGQLSLRDRFSVDLPSTPCPPCQILWSRRRACPDQRVPVIDRANIGSRAG